MAKRKASNPNTENILALLSGFASGNFKNRINPSSDPSLTPIIDKLNEVAQILETREQERKSKIDQEAKFHLLSERAGDPMNEFAHTAKELKRNLFNTPIERVTSTTTSDRSGKIESLSAVEDIAELKQTQIEAETIFETMSEGLVIQGSDGEIQRFNPEALKILGLTADELLGRTSMDPRWKTFKEDGSPFPGQDHPAMVALRTNSPVRNAIMRLTLPSGEERWIKINAIPFQGQNERKVACTFSDFTEIIKTNRDIEHIFSHSMDLICIASTDGSFKKVSPSFTTILGYDEKELLSKPFLEFIHPDDLEATANVVETLSRGIPLVNFENRYRAKSGEYRIMSWVCEPDTQTGLLYATGRDVTALRSSEIRNKQILAALEQAAIIAFTDPRGKITEVNESFCRISGYSREELIGKDHRILNSGLHSKSLFEDLWRTIQSGKTWTGDIGNRTKAGDLYYVRSVITPLKGAAGNIEQYMAIRFDVTEAKRLEATLAEAQQIAKIGSWKYDLRTGEQTWSSEHYRIFEIDEPQSQDALHRLYRDRIHPDDRPELDRVIKHALKFGKDFTYNHRVYLDNGSRLKHVRGIGKVTKNEDGKPIYISGTCQDLSDLVALENQNRFILKSMGIGIWKFNPVTQDLQWDQSMYDLYELNSQDFSGHYQAWESSLSPEAKKRAVEELGLALSGKKDFDTTFEIITKSGARKHLGGKGIVVRNESNQPVMMYGINWDKTKEVLAETKLNEMISYLQTVFDFVPGPVYSKRPDGKYIFVNNKFRETVPVPPGDITQFTDLDIFSKEIADILMNNDKKVTETKRSQHYQEKVPTPNGTIRSYDSYKFPVLNQTGEVISITGMSFDITENLKLKEQVEQERLKSFHNSKMASLGEMSAGIAHEINNPLAIISGSLVLLHKFKDNPEKFATKVNAIQKSCNRIEKIVKGLKKFSRSSEGAPAHQNHSLNEIISEVMTLTEAKAKRHAIQVILSLKDNLVVHCDDVEIEQVLVNLTNNAIDAVKDSKERWVKISSFEQEGQAVVQVLDSGSGLSPEIEEKLFQPFFTTKPVGEGTGLGLSITKGILDQHKASISINRSFKNTCFEIRFPKRASPSNLT